MKVEQVETYIKEKVKETLGVIESFEKKVIDDRTNVEEMRKRILKNKDENGSWKDVKDDLIGIQKVHYYSFLLEQDLKNQHIRAEELLTQANVFGIDLGLEGRDAEAAKNILKGQNSMFGMSRDNKGNPIINLLDSPLKAQIEFGIESRLKDEKGLQEIYQNMAPVNRTMDV